MSTARLWLWFFAWVFGIGAAYNWEAMPVAAGMMSMLLVACLIGLLLVPSGRARGGTIPTPPRRGPMDDSEKDAAAKDIIENVVEYGTFRVDGEVKVFCPACKSWCVAEMKPSTTPFAGLTMGCNPGSTTLQLHLEVDLHVHDHECLRGRDIVTSLNPWRAHG